MDIEKLIEQLKNLEECEHYNPEEYFSPCVLPQGLECAKPNDFCSYGHRKEDKYEVS